MDILLASGCAESLHSPCRHGDDEYSSCFLQGSSLCEAARNYTLGAQISKEASGAFREREGTYEECLSGGDGVVVIESISFQVCQLAQCVSAGQSRTSFCLASQKQGGCAGCSMC